MKKTQNEWSELAKKKKKNEFAVKKLLNDNLVEKLCDTYKSLTELRNDVNHAGFLNEEGNKAITTKKIKSKLKKILDSYQSILLYNQHLIS